MPPRPLDATREQRAELPPARRRRLMREFHGNAKRMARLLPSRLGAEGAETAVAEAQREYERLILEIPRRVTFMAAARDATYPYLAFYLVLSRRGLDAAEIGALLHDAYELAAGRFPATLVRPLLRLLLPFARRKLRQDAALSQERRDPDDFVYEIVAPEPGGTDLAFDVTDCAICKAFARHDALEIVPWICALDDAMSDQFGLGLRRRGTRAVGAPCCDFRYRLGGEPLRLESRKSLPVVSS